MAAIPVHNPIIPFIGLIPGGLFHGRMIRIRGVMKPYADRFNINLQCGPCTNPLDDVALHIDVRPSENIVVRNYYGENGWGVEERYGGCPIQPGQSYEILILAQNTGYKIAINGIHFCEFAHRVPLSRVHYIHINRDTNVNFIGLEEDTPVRGTTHIAPIYATPAPIPPPVNYGFVQSSPAPTYIATSPVPPPVSYAPPSSYMPPAGGVINAPIHPYNAALSYGGIPPPSYSSPYAAGNTYYSRSASYPMNQEEGKGKKFLKYAAVAGGVGLGAYVLGKALDGCDSDSD